MILAQIKRSLEHPVVAGVAVASVGTLVFLVARSFLDGDNELPTGVMPPMPSVAPFADIPGRLVWPVVTNDSRLGQVAYVDAFGTTHGNSARRFGASRDGRRHAGIDLYGHNGDPVLAIADGTVIDTQSFHLGSDAILVAHEDVVVLYGEVEPRSWNEFGVGIGSRVRAGAPIARVACMVGIGSSCKSHMLHLETYRPGTTQNQQWHGSVPPPALLDPTLLLLRSAPPGTNQR